MPVAITEEYINEKIYSRNDLAKLLYKFYEKVKHGDEEHQRWLRDETLKFIGEETSKEAVEAHRAKMQMWKENNKKKKE